MKILAIFLLIGLSILSYAYSISPYTNESLFNERHMALSAGQSKEFWNLRSEMLTSKFQLQDYGITILVFAVALFCFARNGWGQIKAPASRIKLIGIAALAPLLTAVGYVFDLFQAFSRGEFPYWADSIGIPIMGTPFLFIILLVWAGAHLGFLRSNYQSAPLALAVSRQANCWLLAISAITFLLTALFVGVGQYWYAIPSCVWLYFYMSLAATRCARLDHA